MTAQNANTTSRCIVIDQEVFVYFDNDARALTAEEIADGRLLEGATYGVNGTCGLAYDNPAGTKDGDAYIENSVQIASDMDALIANGGNCNGGSERRLEEDCVDFGVGNVAEFSGFEAQTTNAPSSMPSVSHQPSEKPSYSPSESPSRAPLNPTQSPTPPEPSSKPSAAPSGRPSRDCPKIIDECFNGGFFSLYTCRINRPL